MSLSKYQLRQKQARRAQRMEHKEKIDSASFAFTTCTIIAMDAAKQVWKENASNPKMEQFLETILRTWTAIADNKVSIDTIMASMEATTKISFDPKTGTFTNLKGIKKN